MIYFTLHYIGDLILRRIAQTSTLLACLLVSAASTAQVTSYVFGGVGEAQNGTRETATRLGGGLELGIVPFLTPSVEASYFTSDGADGMAANGKLDIPFPLPLVSPFIKAGVARVEEGMFDETDSIMYGVGIEVDAFGLGVRLDAERYEPHDQHDIDVWTLGASYRF